MGLKISQLPERPAEDGMMIPASLGGMTYKLSVGMAGGVPKMVPPSVAGNLAALNAEGNPQDSGKKPGDFAPSGWGYGGNLPDVVITNVVDSTAFEMALDTLMSSMPDLTAKQIRFMDFPTLMGYQGVGTLFKHSVEYCSLLGHAPNGIIVHKCKNSDAGGWQPWEWVNPPMLPGVEYRTTYRMFDLPAYTKTLPGTALPVGGGTTRIQIGAENIRNITLDSQKSTVASDYCHNMLFNPEYITKIVFSHVGTGYSDGYVDISSTAAAGNAHATLTVVYTKTSD